MSLTLDAEGKAPLKVAAVFEGNSEIGSEIDRAFNRIKTNKDLIEFYRLEYKSASEPIIDIPTDIDLVIGPDRTSALNYLSRSDRAKLLSKCVFIAPFVTGSLKEARRRLTIVDSAPPDDQVIEPLFGYIRSLAVGSVGLVYTDDEWGTGLMNQVVSSGMFPRLLPLSGELEEKADRESGSGANTKQQIRKWIEALRDSNTQLVLVAVQRNNTVNYLIEAIHELQNSFGTGYFPNVVILREVSIGSRGVRWELVSRTFNVDDAFWPPVGLGRRQDLFCLSALNRTSLREVEWRGRSRVEALEDVVSVVLYFAKESENSTDAVNKIQSFYRREVQIPTVKFKTAFHSMKNRDEADLVSLVKVRVNANTPIGDSSSYEVPILGSRVLVSDRESIMLTLLRNNQVLLNPFVLIAFGVVATFSLAMQLSDRVMIPISVLLQERSFLRAGIVNIVLVYLIWVTLVYQGVVTSVGWLAAWSALGTAFVGTSSLGVVIDILRRLPFGEQLANVIHRFHSLTIENVDDRIIQRLIASAKVEQVERDLPQVIMRIQIRMLEGVKSEDLRKRFDGALAEAEKVSIGEQKVLALLRLWLQLLRFLASSTKEFLDEVSGSMYFDEASIEEIRCELRNGELGSRIRRFAGRFRLRR